MKTLLKPFIFLTFLSLLVGLYFYSHKVVDNSSNKKEVPYVSNCKNLRKMKLSFKSTVVLHELIEKKLFSDKNYSTAVKEQIKYIGGYFHFLKNANLKVIPQKLETFNITSVSRVKYGQDLTLKGDNSFSFDLPDQVSKEDDALEINYKASLEVLLCQTYKNNIHPAIILPRDPYFIYWNIDKKFWPKKIHLGREEVIHPCSDSRFVDLNVNNYLWYAWKPYETLFKNNKTTSCKKELEKIGGVSIVNGYFSEIASSSSGLSSSINREVLKFGVVWGLIQGNYDKGMIQKVLKFIQAEKIFNHVKTDYSMILKKWKRNDIDISIKSMLNFLVAFKKNVSVNSLDFQSHGNYGLLSIDGNYKSNDKKIQLSLYIGPTDYENEVDFHWSFLKRQFETSDYVFLVSHAGMGANFSFKNMKERLNLSDNELKKVLNKKSRQLFGVVSCFSTFYFNSDFKNARVGKDSEVVLLASEGYAYMLPLAFIEWGGASAYDSEVDLKSLLNKYTSSRDIVFYDRF